MAGEPEVKGLDYYIEHPDEMTEEVLAKFGTDGDGEELGGTVDEVVAKEVVKEGVKEGVTPPAAKVEDPPETPPAKEAEKLEDANSVVKSKDGKHDIPYAVLDAERRGRQEAEKKATDQQAEIERLQALIDAAGKTPPKGAKEEPPPVDEVEVMSEEDIAEVEKDFPAVAKTMRAQAKQMADMQQLLRNVAQSEGNRRQSEATTAKSTVQLAIDANPKLAFLQAKDPEAWTQAVEFDKALRTNPRNKSLEMKDRFAKVVGMYESAFGEIVMPAGTPAPTPPATPAAPAAKAPAPPAKESDALAAARKLIAEADAAVKNGKVASLSDIPGGVPPETDPLEQLGLLSSAELGNKFMTMDLKAISQILAKAG